MELSPWGIWYLYKEGGKFSYVRLYYLDIDEVSNFYEQMDPISEDLSAACLNTLVID